MFKKISVVIFLNLLCRLTTAQQIYFNNRYDIEDAEGGTSIISTDSGFVTVEFSTDFSTYKMNLIFIDSLGNFLFEKSYGAPYSSYWGGFWGSLVKTYDGGFALGGTISDTTGASYVLLYKFNSGGDTIWTQKFGNGIYQTGINVKQTADSGYIIGAFNADFDPQGNCWLIKTDSAGNFQWQKYYGSSLFDEGSVIQTNDGGYLIAGEWGGWAAMDLGTLFALKTDSAGNQQWFSSFPALHENWGWNAAQTMDGGYVICGEFTDTVDAVGQRFGRPWLVKLDSAGSLVWEKKYGPIKYNVTLNSIRELTDSSIITCGTVYDSLSFKGILIKTTGQGDSLLYEYYRNLYGTSHNLLRDLYPTNDGGIVCTGFVVPHLPDTGTQDLWVLKLDSNGCEIANCLVGIEENNFVESENINAFPNPFSNYLTIKSNYKEGEIEIRNVLAEIVFQKRIKAEESTFNLSKLTTGMYFLTLKSKEKIFTRKILKE